MIRAARALGCFACLLLANAPSADALTLTVANTNGAAGALAFIPVRVTGFTNISTLQFSMHWDTALASFDGVERFALPTLAFGTNHATNGNLTLSWDDPELLSKTLSDDTPLFFLRLRLGNNPGASSPVVIDGNPIPVEASDNNLNLIPVSVQNGAVTINIEPPSIVTPPQDQTAAVGENITFLVLADGTPPLFYEWRKNGFPLPGAAGSSLLLTNVQSPSAGDYSVVVTNAAGKATSAVARLTVTIPPDTTPPVIIITSPTSGPSLSVTSNTVSLAGNADDNVGVVTVTWSNNRGGSGTASGTNLWTAGSIPLQLGENVITVAATDAATNLSTDTLTVTYTLPPDTFPPSVIITSPTASPEFSTETNALSVAGAADDNVAVTAVTWSNHRGGSGIAAGTNSWSIPSIVVQNGTNMITITARDAAGNTGTDTLIVTYTPPPDTASPVIHITSPTNAPTFAIASNTVSLAGTASDNVDVITVTWFNNRGGSGNADGATNWSIPGILLQTGDNILTLIAIDAAGNTGVDTLTVTYTPPDDTTPPVAVITNPTESPTLSFATNRISLAGSASDNVAVTAVTWSNDRGGNGTAVGTNSWSVPDIVLLSGDNVITITAVDAIGNAGIDTLTVTYTPPSDTTPPVPTILSPTDGPAVSIASNRVSLAGTASDNVAVTAVTWSNDRGGSGAAVGTDDWSIADILLQAGTNLITVMAADAAGNTGTDTLTITYMPPSDITAPVVIITSPTATPTLSVSNSTLTLVGIADDNVGVTQVTWTNNRGGGGSANGLNDWSINALSLQVGENLLTVSATDAAGNIGTDTLTVTYQPPPDTTPPVITITSPTVSPTLAVSNSTVSLAGAASDNVDVTQVTWENSRGGSGAAIGTSNWIVATVSLQIGENVLTVKASDAAGNTNSDTVTIVYSLPTDTTPPTVTIASPTSAPTLSVNNNILSVSGTATDDVAVTRVTWNNDRGGGGLAAGTNDWSVAGILLVAGDNVITITAFDAATNSSTDTLTVTFNGPTGEVTSVSGKLLYYPPSGQALPDVTINANGSADVSTQTGTNGTFTLGLNLGGSFMVQPVAPASGPVAAAVSTLDISLIRRHISNEGSLDSPYKFLAADVNGSHTVSSSDITAIRRLVLGATDTLPSGLWRFVPLNHIFGGIEDPWSPEPPTNLVYTSLAGPMVDQDFYAIKMGDVNASWTACQGEEVSPCATVPTRTNEVTFTTTSHTNSPGDIFAIQVLVRNFVDVTSVQFTLGWDAAVLRYRSVGAFGLAGLLPGSFNTAQTPFGKLGLSWDDPSGLSASLPDGSAIFVVTFEVIAGSLAASQVTIVENAEILPAPEVGVNFQQALFQSENGNVTIVTDPGPPIDSSTINYDSTTFAVSIPTAVGWIYILEYTDSLSSPGAIQWESLPAVPGDGALKVLIDPSATSPQRFYRVRIQPR